MKKIYSVVIVLTILSSHSCGPQPFQKSSFPTPVFSQSQTPTNTTTTGTQPPLPRRITLTPSLELKATQTVVTIVSPTKTPVFEAYQPISTGNAKSVQIVYELPATLNSKEIYGLEFSPLGGTLAVANESGDVHLWRYPIQGAKISVQDFQSEIFQGGNGKISTLAFSPDGKTIASATESGLLLVQDATNGKILSQATTDIDAYDIEYSPDGSVLAITGYKTSENKYIIQLWSMSNTQLIAILDDFPEWYDAICSLAISSNGSVLAAGFCDYHIMAWDLKNEYKSLGNIVGQYAYECYSHCPFPTNRTAFMPKSTILASGTDNVGIPLMDVYTGRLALSMSTARAVKWTDPSTGKTISPVSAPDVTDIAFSPDGTILAIAAWSEIQLRSTKTNELLAYFEIPEGNGATKISFSPDSLLIAVGTNNGNLYIIGAKDLVTGK